MNIPAFPSDPGTMPIEWSTYFHQLHSLLFPKLQSFSLEKTAQAFPFTGVTGAATATLASIGSEYTVSLVFAGASDCLSGFMTLPFAASQDAVLVVAVDGTALAATVPAGQSIVTLPDWNSSNPVYIYGKVGAK